MKKLTTNVLAVVLTSAFVVANAQTDTTKTRDIDEVVVTAIGIKRKPKEMSYSVSRVKDEDLTATNATNAASVMIGKVSGLNVNVVNNGVNPSTRVILRGFRSIGGDNEALVVVDGFPAPRGVLDRINPDDIQEVTVLKGANASALYGSDASNGVIVITTKKGKSDRLKVTLNSAVEAESVSFMPKMQSEFGVGGFPDGTLYPLENVNWGPRYDGSLVPASETYDNGDVWMVPFRPIKNNHKNFFDTGMGYRNGITVSSGDRDSNMLFSVDFFDKAGIVPKDEYNRTNVRLKAGKRVGNLEYNGNFSFFTSKSDVVPTAAGRQGRPLYWNILNTPMHIPLTQMKNWRDGYYTRNEVSYYRFYENPYFIVDNNRQMSKFNEFTFIGDMKYDFNDWLSAKLIVGYTFNNQRVKTNLGALRYAFELEHTYSTMDEYGASTSTSQTTTDRFNSDFLISMDKDISESFNLKANVGYNVRIENANSINVSGSNLIIPDFWNVSTRTGELGGGESESKYRKIGFYGDATIGFKDFLFLNGSVRNDVSSALSKENRSYWYPGGGISFVASSAFPGMVTAKGLSYMKLSANITRSGKDTDPYRINETFGTAAGFPHGALPGLTQGNGATDPNLSPEFTLSKEVGLELGFLNNRITANLTAFRTNTTKQILAFTTSVASGANSYTTNIGDMMSEGIEADLNLGIIRKPKFTWDVGFNYSYYGSMVENLIEGVDEVSLGGYAEAAYIYAVLGRPFTIIKTTHYERDPQGRVIVGDDGDPIIASGLKDMGKTTPSSIYGLNTTIGYKGFKLYVAADYRTGHVFYNQLGDLLEFTGLSEHSASSGRMPFVFPNSSYSDGNGGFIANTDRLTSGGGNAFWDEYNTVKENYVSDASAIKIREISLSYDMNKNLVQSMGLTGLTFGVYARNPFMFLPKTNVLSDPEFNFTTGNAIGIGNQAQTPPTRIIGFKLTANF